MTYAEFWPVYLRAHAHPANRLLHIVGTGLGVACVIAAPFLSWWLVPAAPVIGYACAWTGHFGIEGNRPATFGHPFWSLFSDFRMLALFLSRRLTPALLAAGVVRPLG
jgi:hypothetical protein